MESDPLLMQQIDGYLINEKIGQGGMAAVYRARDVALDRDVVLKVLPPHLAALPALRQRFQREARATARLHHPNIVPIFATGETPSGLPYIALQHIEGGSLRDYLARLSEQGQWISTLYALNIVRQIAAALAVAHAAQIVHRDLKPSNILLRADGTPVLSDLGIAAVQQATTQLTQTGGVMGTPSYMSPEQARSQAIDGRSDIYSLGVILYELLSGRLPFDADSPWAMIHQHIYERPSPLDQVRPDLSPQTLAVVERCLQKEPADRYADAHALEAALQQAITAEDGNPAVSVATWMPPPVHPVSKPPPAARKRPFWLLGVFGVIAAAALVIWLAWAPVGDDPFEETAVAAAMPTSAVAPPTVDTDLPPTSTLAATARSTESPTPPSTEAAPAALLPAAQGRDAPPPAAHVDFPHGLIAFHCGPDGRNQTYLSSPDGHFRLPVPNQPAHTLVPAFSADGTEISYRSIVNGAWQIFVSRLDGANRRQITAGDGRHAEAVWSPDGSRFVFTLERGGERHLYLMNSDGTNQQQLTFAGTHNDDPSWSIHNEIVYESNQDGRYDVYRISPDGGEPQLLISHGASSTTPAWSPDGQWLAFESRQGGVSHIWIATTEGTNLQQVTTIEADNQRPAWSPDGQRIAFFSNHDQPDPARYDIWIAEVAGGAAQRLTERGDCYNPAWIRPSAEFTRLSFAAMHETIPAATATAEPDARLCELPLGAAVFAGDNLRLWPAPDVTAVTASGALEPDTPLRVVAGPAWGRLLRDDDVSGWWWRVETERGDRAGWVWQARLQECAQQ